MGITNFDLAMKLPRLGCNVTGYNINGIRVGPPRLPQASCSRVSSMFSRGNQRYERDSYNHWGLLSSSMARPANIRRNKHIEQGQQTTLCPRASRRAKSHRKSRPLNTSSQQRICIYLKIPAAEKRTQGRKEEKKKTPHFSFSLFFLSASSQQPP